jgi:hypothetical protein
MPGKLKAVEDVALPPIAWVAQPMPLAEGSAAAMEAAQRKAALQALGRRALALAGETVASYMELCRYVREKQYAPKEVSLYLGEVGYPPERISEIKRVAFCSEELWERYIDGTMGFRPALLKAREETEKTEGQGVASPARQKQLKREVKVRQLEAHTAKALGLAADLGKGGEWKLNGWVLTIKQVKGKG